MLSNDPCGQIEIDSDMMLVTPESYQNAPNLLPAYWTNSKNPNITSSNLAI